MISDALRQHCLIDELQLEQRLNRSLQQGQQAGETISRHRATAKPADMLDIIDNPMPDLDVHFFDAA